MISAVSRQRYEEELADLNKELETTLRERVNEAKAKGDLSENAEYTAAMADSNNARLRKSILEELLSMEVSDTSYSNTITVGTFINISYKFADGSVEDFGLHMFDGVGSNLYKTISPNSELGRQIQGTTGGTFTIKDTTSRTVTVIVTVESESKMQEYLDSTPSPREGYGYVFSDW